MGLGGTDVVLITHYGEQFGQRIMNVFPLVVEGPTSPNPVPFDLAALLNEWQGGGAGANDRVTPWLTMFGNDYTLDFVRAQQIWPERSVLVDGADGQVGTHASNADSANVAAVVTKRTLRSGRRFVSTTHIGGIPHTACVGGTITPTYKGIVDAWALTMLTPVVDLGAGLTYKWCIFHKSFTPKVDDITSRLVMDQVRVMRRRTVGLGI